MIKNNFHLPSAPERLEDDREVVLADAAPGVANREARRVVGAGENIHIVRGTVSSGGAVLDGTGFTVNHAATGDYGITFTTPFATRPTVTASVEWEFPVSDPARIAMVDNFTATGGNIVVMTSSSQSLLNARFNFIAIGIR